MGSRELVRNMTFHLPLHQFQHMSLEQGSGLCTFKKNSSNANILENLITIGLVLGPGNEFIKCQPQPVVLLIELITL